MSSLAEDLVFACILYAVLLLVIGAFARQARREDTLEDFFLAGRSFGFAVLLFTLFATQFSGNSFSGFPGQVYREGLAYFMGATFTVGIVAGYTLFAPRLRRLAGRHKFLTPTDFLWHRFESPAISYIATVIFILTLCNFLLSQLIALGQAFSGISDGAIPYWIVVAVGGAVVLVYQVVGGMRAVAWTDVLQGLLVMLGILVFIVMLGIEVGTPGNIVQTVRLLRPELAAPPTLELCLVWLSNLLLLALGAPLYPQAIQRIYAARDARSLKYVLAILAILALVIGTTVVFIGAAGIALFPELEGVTSDQVTFRVVGYLVESSSMGYYPALMLMVAIIAAIMSTADSCLLSVSSVFTKDIFARAKGASVAAATQLTRRPLMVSTGVMLVLILIAMRPVTTLWGLLVIKFEILIQLSPAFVLGTLHERGEARAFGVNDILAGLVTGLGSTLTLYLLGATSVYGLNAGTVGVALNYCVVLGMRRRRLRLSNETAGRAVDTIAA